MIKKFIDKYGESVLEEILNTFLDEDNNYSECGDDLCDDESCLLYRAFKKLIKYR